MRVLGVLVLFSFYFFGCKENEQPEPVVRSTTEVLIANEGNFGWGEGTLSIYNPETKTVQNDVYKAKNGNALGNVFQSITAWKNNYFLVANNSGKILITDTNFILEATISGLLSPRYVYIVNEQKAYVTDLYANAISVVDLAAPAVSKTIPLSGWSEKGVVFNSQFWVTAPQSKYVYCIDIETDKLQDSIEIGFASESIILDNEMQLWVLSKGDPAKLIAPNLVKINPFFRTKIGEIELSGLPSNLVYSPLSNTLYFLNNGVYTMNLSSDLEPQLWLSSANKNLYGLAANPYNTEVYVSNIFDYVQKSSVYRYSSEGEMLDEFKAGIIAGNFFFKH